MKFKQNLASRATVDLIPMIDVVFQLILFFLVSTTFALLPGITLNLPRSGTAESTETKGLTITAKEDGRYWLNSDEITLEALDAALRDYDIAAEERIDYPIRLEADELVTNGVIVGIFDILRKNGFSSVNLRTTVPD
jgi:biopolymer transport protein ExbD